MSEFPLISVIVPVYKVEAYLPRCLDTLLAQRYENFEVVAVDDGSPDRCGEILEEYAKKDVRIRVIHRENGGLSAARNTGIEAAKGAFLAFVDSDDWVEPNFLEILAAPLLEQGAEIASCGAVNHLGDRAVPNALEKPLVMGPKEALERMCYNDHFFVTTWDKLYRRELFEGIRFPEGKLFEDTATTFTLVDRAKTIVATPGICYHYITRPSSITGAGFHPKKLDYVEAAEKMAGFIEEKYPDLKDACNRKRAHALLSTLTVLAEAPERNRAIEKELMAKLKPIRRGVFRNKRTPKRDKAALVSLSFGFGAFSFVWKIYSRVKKGSL